jgi:FkbM family methyltransferase
MSTFREYVPSVRTGLVPRVVQDWLTAHRRGQRLPDWRAAELAALHLLPSLELLERGLVLDLGANVGDWTDAVLRVAPGARVIAVEPSDEPRATLERRFNGDPRVEIDARAVADVPGTRTFHVTTHTHNSSLHAPRPSIRTSYSGGWEVARMAEVATTTVDELTDGTPVSVLKIDVQGAEREVLEGARQTLQRTDALLIEVTFVSHYEGDTTFPLLHDWLTSVGFELAGLGAPFLSRRGTVLWCDACYTPAPSSGPAAGDA